MVTSAMVIHYVDNMDAALGFYRDGLGLKVSTESPGWSMLQVTESLDLALHTRGAGHEGPGDVHPFDALETTLVLNVDDLDACCTRIKEQGGVVERIIEREAAPFEQVSASLTKTVRERITRQMMRQVARSLLTKADIVILDPVLNKAWEQQRATAFEATE